MKKNSVVDVDGLFMFTKCLKFTTKETFGYNINIYFKISKKLDKVYDDFKD
jgi:hypothetical protein